MIYNNCCQWFKKSDFEIGKRRIGNANNLINAAALKRINTVIVFRVVQFWSDIILHSCDFKSIARMISDQIIVLHLVQIPSFITIKFPSGYYHFVYLTFLWCEVYEIIHIYNTNLLNGEWPWQMARPCSIKTWLRIHIHWGTLFLTLIWSLIVTRPLKSGYFLNHLLFFTWILLSSHAKTSKVNHLSGSIRMIHCAV